MEPETNLRYYFYGKIREDKNPYIAENVLVIYSDKNSDLFDKADFSSLEGIFFLENLQNDLGQEVERDFCLHRDHKKLIEKTYGGKFVSFKK